MWCQFVRACLGCEKGVWDRIFNQDVLDHGIDELLITERKDQILGV